ncbi:MAG: hypothetical protein GY715_22430 [Planctomycetes bacterium]|nr:hypothetical protein [Planctomycetota bacterium]
MTSELHEGRILQGRFVLRRGLGAAASAPLWTAEDRHLQTEILLRLHRGLGATGEATRERILRDARRHRRSRHPNAALVCDVHEDGELLFESIEPGEGELLSTVLERTGAMPYRAALERLRPLVAAIVHVHEHGGEHGRIGLDHVLVDPSDRWILLPGDATAPPRSDLMQLGGLLAAVLTGNRPPEPPRALNDVTDRLHAGRTVPALLNQLVSDLGEEGVSQRPGGMREVLHRLSQIEDFVAPAPAPAIEAPPPERDEQPPAARPSRFPVARFAWLAALAAILAGAVFFGPALLRRSPAPTTPDEPVTVDTPAPDTTVTDPAEPPPEPATPADDAAQTAAQASADEALGVYLPARRRADEIGAATWSSTAYEAAAAKGGEGDVAYLEQQYTEAADHYLDAAEAFYRIAASRIEALSRLLREGAEAIESMDATGATEAFGSALLIEPGHDEAQAGLERAGTLEELRALLVRGGEHEVEGRLPLALIDYRAATELDPLSETASTSYERVRTALADEEFRRLMALGMEAYHAGALEDASRHLLEAERFRPNAPEVAPALAMVAEARLRRRVERLQARAVSLENEERWQDAWNAYRNVLALDTTIQFAQDGKTRCEESIRLSTHARRFLDDPDLLLEPAGRSDAQQLLAELATVPDKGPKLARMHADLDRQVRLATTPLRVLVRSDGKTEVVVYRVRPFGTFESIKLDLLPGEYTFVGHRKGYQDVRITLRLKPGAENTVVTVICTKTI